MSEFRPISEIDDLEKQDEAEMSIGYMAGLRGDPAPGSQHSRSFWHGWRNGMVDSGRAKIDSAQQDLARAIVMRQRAH